MMLWLERAEARLRNWFIFFLLYCAVQLSVRLVFGHKMNIDEAQVWLWAHELAWGYGPQPPLYVWLLRAVFTVIGATAFSLTLFKQALLFGIFGAVMGIALRWTGTDRVPPWFAGAAALMLFWLPEFSWESQRIHTHNVLAALISLLMTWQALRAREKPTQANHALMGLLIGLGLLSKWNFAIIALAVISVLMLERGYRRPDWKAVIWWVGLPLLMIAPTVYWIMSHPVVATASYYKLGVEPALPRHLALIEWSVASLRALMIFMALPALVLGAFVFLARERNREVSAFSAAARDEMRFVTRCTAVALGALVIGGAVMGTTILQYRWLFPILVPFMPVMTFQMMMRMRQDAWRRLIRMTFIAPVVLVVLMSVTLLGKKPHRYFDNSLVAPVLPLNDERSPYVASVTMAAQLKAAQPDRVLQDEALLMARPCPENVILLEPRMRDVPGLATWLFECGLVPDNAAAPLFPERPEVAVWRFVRGQEGPGGLSRSLHR